MLCLSGLRRSAPSIREVEMDNVVNFELLSDPLNWLIVFLILYFLALMTQHVSIDLRNAGINLI